MEYFVFFFIAETASIIRILDKNVLLDKIIDAYRYFENEIIRAFSDGTSNNTAVLLVVETSVLFLNKHISKYERLSVSNG